MSRMFRGVPTPYGSESRFSTPNGGGGGSQALNASLHPAQAHPGHSTSTPLMHPRDSPTEGMESLNSMYSWLDVENCGRFPVARLYKILEASGLIHGKLGIVGLQASVDSLVDEEGFVSYEAFVGCLSDGDSLLNRALTGHLTVPDWPKFCEDIEKIFRKTEGNSGGANATYIPELALVDSDLFAVGVTTVDGQHFSMGDSEKSFCLQSCVKPFSYAMAVDELGSANVHRYVGREPSGAAFNAFQLSRNNTPHNPLVNSGAIVICSLLKRELSSARRIAFCSKVLSQMAGNEPLGFSQATYLSEKDTADPNYALAHNIRSHSGFPKGSKIDDVLDFYFQLCSIKTDVRRASYMAATLANAGTCPTTGEVIFSPETVKGALQLMFTCGLYDSSGEWAATVGLPAKSGVAGCILVVVPNVMGFAVYSPRLDDRGNSVRGTEFFQRLTKHFSLSIFDQLFPSSRRDPTMEGYGMTPAILRERAAARRNKNNNNKKNGKSPMGETVDSDASACNSGKKMAKKGCHGVSGHHHHHHPAHSHEGEDKMERVLARGRREAAAVAGRLRMQELARQEKEDGSAIDSNVDTIIPGDQVAANEDLIQEGDTLDPNPSSSRPRDRSRSRRGDTGGEVKGEAGIISGSHVGVSTPPTAVSSLHSLNQSLVSSSIGIPETMEFPSQGNHRHDRHQSHHYHRSSGGPDAEPVAVRSAAEAIQGVGPSGPLPPPSPPVNHGRALNKNHPNNNHPSRIPAQQRPGGLHKMPTPPSTAFPSVGSESMLSSNKNTPHRIASVVVDSARRQQRGGFPQGSSTSGVRAPGDTLSHATSGMWDVASSPEEKGKPNSGPQRRAIASVVLSAAASAREEQRQNDAVLQAHVSHPHARDTPSAAAAAAAAVASTQYANSTNPSGAGRHHRLAVFPTSASVASAVQNHRSGSTMGSPQLSSRAGPDGMSSTRRSYHSLARSPSQGSIASNRSLRLAFPDPSMHSMASPAAPSPAGSSRIMVASASPSHQHVSGRERDLAYVPMDAGAVAAAAAADPDTGALNRYRNPEALVGPDPFLGMHLASGGGAPVRYRGPPSSSASGAVNPPLFIGGKPAEWSTAPTSLGETARGVPVNLRSDIQ